MKFIFYYLLLFLSCSKESNNSPKNSSPYSPPEKKNRLIQFKGNVGKHLKGNVGKHLKGNEGIPFSLDMKPITDRDNLGGVCFFIEDGKIFLSFTYKGSPGDLRIETKSVKNMGLSYRENLSNSLKLEPDLIEKFLNSHFDVYESSKYGNLLCTFFVRLDKDRILELEDRYCIELNSLIPHLNNKKLSYKAENVYKLENVSIYGKRDPEEVGFKNYHWHALVKAHERGIFDNLFYPN